MELIAIKGNLLLRDPLKNLDEFSARRLKTLIYMISQEEYEEFRISITGELTQEHAGHAFAKFRSLQWSLNYS